MKEILINKISDPQNRTKVLSISQEMDDKECTTHVRKKFVYMVFPTDKMEPETGAPHIYIKKHFDTKKKIEKCTFQIKGNFYITYQRLLLKVRFQHTLNISLTWKTKAFSPKKSEVLT